MTFQCRFVTYQDDRYVGYTSIIAKSNLSLKNEKVQERLKIKWISSAQRRLRLDFRNKKFTVLKWNAQFKIWNLKSRRHIQRDFLSIQFRLSKTKVSGLRQFLLWPTRNIIEKKNFRSRLTINKVFVLKCARRLTSMDSRRK